VTAAAAAVVDYKAKQYLEDILFLKIQASTSDHNNVLRIFLFGNTVIFKIPVLLVFNHTIINPLID